MRTTASVTSLRSSLARRRTQRERRRQLTCELAAFDSAPALLELEAIVARHDDADSREVREVMSRLAAKRVAR